MHTYSFHVTDRQRNVIEQEYGHRVSDPWLKNLPETVSNLCTQWNLAPTGVPDSGSMSACVYVSDTENNHYVLKLPVHPEVSQPEVATLNAWGKQKLAPHIQRYDQETGAILLNRIQPGTPAEPGTGYTDIDTLARVIHTMTQTPLPLTSIPTYRGRVNMRHTWARNRFQQTNNAAGLHLLDKSDALLRTLTPRGTSNKLLHGDLQPKTFSSTTTAPGNSSTHSLVSATLSTTSHYGQSRKHTGDPSSTSCSTLSLVPHSCANSYSSTG